MKKYGFKIASLALCIILIFMNLVSCSLLDKVTDGLSNLPIVGDLFEKDIEDYPEQERAFVLFDKLDASMEEVSSYEEESLISLSFDYENVPFNVSLDGFAKVAGNNSNDYFEYSEVEQTVYSAGALSENFTVSQAYTDGKMYFSQKSGNVIGKMFSNTTYEEYLECRSFASKDPLDISIVKLATVTEAIKDGNGLWVATYRCFPDDTTKSALLSMVDDSLFMMLTDKAVLKDMEITLKSDSNMRPKSCDVEFVFESSDTNTSGATSSSQKLPSVKINTEYEDYNITSIDDVDLTGYSEVDSVPIIYKLFAELREIKNKDNGTIELNGSYIIDKETFISDKYSGTYSNSDSGYKFNVSNNSNGTKTTIAYSYGTLRITQNGNVNTTEVSELVAKETANSIIDPISFSVTKVLDVIKKSETDNTVVYEFKINSKQGPEYNLAQSSGGTVQGNEAKLTATFVDGKLTKYVYTSHCTIRIYSTNHSCTVTVESKF